MRSCHPVSFSTLVGFTLCALLATAGCGDDGSDGQPVPGAGSGGGASGGEGGIGTGGTSAAGGSAAETGGSAGAGGTGGSEAGGTGGSGGSGGSETGGTGGGATGGTGGGATGGTGGGATGGTGGGATGGTGGGATGGTGGGATGGTGGTGGGAVQAKGIYVVDDGKPDFSTALSKSFVDGALVRVGWSMLEPSENSYNFTNLCNKVTTAHALGKRVTLVNYATAPGWLISQLPSSELWTHPQYGSQPVPWSSLGQQKMQAYATAEAEFVCGGHKLKDHPAVTQVDTPIIGMQSVRQAPPYTLSQMIDAVKANVNIWYNAFGEKPGRVFYVGLFPLGTSTADAIAVRNAVQAEHPNHHWFQETWTGAGPSGSLATPLDPNAATRTFFVMLQACGYWSNQSLIKCTFSNPDDPQLAYDHVATDFGAKYLEVYPADLNHGAYQTMFQSIHGLIWM